MKTITQTSHCLAPARAGAPINGPAPSATYARMFPELPSFEADEAFLHALGRGGGLCDGGDIDDSAEALGEVAAGWPIFGQFVAHDITADRSALRVHTDTAVLRNARSPQLNLECLYGDGPVGHPFLYQRNDPAKFLLGARGADVQRPGRSCSDWGPAQRLARVGVTNASCNAQAAQQLCRPSAARAGRQ